MKQYECKKCGHKWYPRTPKKPIVCPKCHLYTWEQEREK